MTDIERLTINYFKKRKKNALEVSERYSEDDTADSFLLKNMRRYSNWAVEKGLVDDRKAIKSMDTIDFSNVYNDAIELGKRSAMPSVGLTDEEIAKVDACWALIIPPFKTGVLKVNKQRYVKYEIQEVDEEENGYLIWIDDYAFEKVWLLENTFAGFFKWDKNGKSINKKCLFATDGFTMDKIISKNLKDNEKDWNQDDILYFNEVLIPALRKHIKKDDLDTVMLHFALDMIRTNLELTESKPKAVRGSGNKIKTAAGEIERNPKPKIVRALANGITFKSVKIPKASSEETIRRYSVEAWKTRGHIRHYKNGKTVYIRESVHHRKCLEGKGKSAIPQTIIKVG